MLQLKNIVKDYKLGDTVVQALKGVDISFRENEFVSILGQSGCGKTTLLNIIGGLDKYTSGDLVINGKSTKDFDDGDWDSYRNHSIGFVFQSYNLIPHQTVLANVELALTISGVSRSERTKRAMEALQKVGLGDQLNKKPNQMSGGQMQRVAIARALVNNPDILLADEPTGALDSETSVQIMELLKEISKDKLIVMVTHNPELAKEYSTRIIRLLDGKVTDDSNPYEVKDVKVASVKSKKELKKERKKNKTSMSFLTALSLSLNNLMTKKTRTFMTAFAGSIGIIGIALILSLSSGAEDYIQNVQEDTLSNYPLTIETAGMNMTSLMATMMSGSQNKQDHDNDKIYSNDILSERIELIFQEIQANDLKSFKQFIESDDCKIKNYVSDIQYTYNTTLNIYSSDTTNGLHQINPNHLFDSIGLNNVSGGMTSMISGQDIWSQMIGNEDLLKSQYDVIAGSMPKNYNEVVVIVDENNEITDFALYALGLKDEAELKEMIDSAINQEEIKHTTKQTSYTYDEILGLTFKLVLNTDYFEKQNGIWVDKSKDDLYMTEVVNNATEVKVVGILKPSENATATSVSGSVGYTAELMKYLIGQVNESEIVKEQKEKADTDIFTGLSFHVDEEQEFTKEDLDQYISALPEEEQAQIMSSIEQAKAMGMPEKQILAAFKDQMMGVTTATYDGNLTLLGVSDLDNPYSINIYPRDFDGKEEITNIIDAYNEEKKSSGHEELVIQYTDFLGLMMSSISTIINAISYILMAFVAISLVVSSIMIGIITYISVLERTKEIGILRAMGASKKDISRVFNAETLIVGFSAGVIGIGITLILCVPINIIIKSLTDISGLCALPVSGGIGLVIISMVLTLIAGLIPSKVAAKKDPVTALRTE